MRLIIGATDGATTASAGETGRIEDVFPGQPADQLARPRRIMTRVASGKFHPSRRIDRIETIPLKQVQITQQFLRQRRKIGRAHV